MLYAEPRKRFEAWAIAAVIHEDADCPSVTCGRRSLGREAAVHETPLDLALRGGPLEWLTVAGFGVEDNGLDDGGGSIEFQEMSIAGDQRAPGGSK